MSLMQKIGSLFVSHTWGNLMLHACGAATIILSLPAHAKWAAVGVMAFAVPKEFWWDVKYEPAQASKRDAYIGGAKDFAGYLLGSVYAAWRCGVFG